jgi:hypothetical protein
LEDDQSQAISWLLSTHADANSNWCCDDEQNENDNNRGI